MPRLGRVILALRVVFALVAHQGGEVAMGSKWRKFKRTILKLPAGLNFELFNFDLSIFDAIGKIFRDGLALQEEAFCEVGAAARNRTSWKWRSFSANFSGPILTTNFELTTVQEALEKNPRWIPLRAVDHFGGEDTGWKWRWQSGSP